MLYPQRLAHLPYASASTPPYTCQQPPLDRRLCLNISLMKMAADDDICGYIIEFLMANAHDTIAQQLVKRFTASPPCYYTYAYFAMKMSIIEPLV